MEENKTNETPKSPLVTIAKLFLLYPTLYFILPLITLSGVICTMEGLSYYTPIPLLLAIPLIGLLVPALVQWKWRFQWRKPYILLTFLAMFWGTVWTGGAVIKQSPLYHHYQQELEEAWRKHAENEENERIAQERFIQDQKASLPRYKVVYNVSGVRYDGGISLFVLIDPVDLSNDGFKSGVTALINRLISEYGAKTSIEMHDNRRSLDVSYQEHVDHRSPTKEEDAIQAVHLVAAFDGELEIQLYPNTLSYFPATSTQHPKVGKYMGTIEFNPVTYTVEASQESETGQAPITVDAKAEAEKKKRKEFDEALSHLQDSGFVMELRPEVNTVMINPLGWLQLTYSEKETTVQFFSQYCQYYCAVQGNIVHLKNGYSGQELAGYGALGIHIKS